MNKKEELLERDEILDEYKWDVESMYSNLDDWEKDSIKLEDRSKELSKLQGRLSENAELLYKGLVLKDEVSRLANKLYTYTSLKLDEDTRKGESQALSDRAFRLYIKVSEAASFFVPELLEINEGKIEIFLQEKKELEMYEHYLKEILRRKDHVLSAREESIMTKVSEISSSPQNVFGMLNNADLKFPKIKNEKEIEVDLTQGNFIPFMESKDRRVRKDAFKGLYSTYKGLENTFASLLDGELKGNKFHAEMRNYNNTMEASLDRNHIPVSVYDNLIDSIHDNMGSMYDYMKIRKKALNLKDHHMYDIYTPIVEDVEFKFDYEEGKEIIKKALEPLGEEYLYILKQGFETGWVDVYENKGKRSGGYSGGSYDSKPFILLNYKDTLDSVSTLAHEMGHSIHSFLSRENQPFIYSNYGIFVAEVASTVNEILLIDYLMKKSKTKEEKKYLLNHQLDSFRTTVYRQTMFAEFERDINRYILEGGALTAEYLNESYKELNRVYYGPDIIIDEEISTEWARIPHFYYDYYVYQYATGYSAAVSIVEKILNNEYGIIENYLKFLKSGSSDYPINILKEVGIDMTTREPIDKALGKFTDLVENMKKMI